MFNFDETATLPKINVPVLVVCGDVDIATKPAASDRMITEWLSSENRVKCSDSYILPSCWLSIVN
jgi:pimeloyl-ACP methyl ester carboxylesterase